MNDVEKTDQEIKTTLAGVGGEKSTSQAEEGALPGHTAQLGSAVNLPPVQAETTAGVAAAVTEQHSPAQGMAGVPAVGEIFQGKYKILRVIATGGMGCVYQARHLELGTDVALKVMAGHLMGQREAVERFKREARAMARVSHPHAVRVLDAGVDQGRLYLVMEFLVGETLRAWHWQYRQQGQSPPLLQILTYASQVLNVLEFMHQQNITHRDLKPDNIFLARDVNGQHVVKVLDFGIAKIQSNTTPAMTTDGVMMGTPWYMSPEQCCGQTVDGRTDIYAMGIVLYELLCGEVPFGGDHLVTVAMKHIHEPVPPLHERAPHVPLRLSEVITQALAKSPEKRFGTAGEFLQVLREIEEHIRQGRGEEPGQGLSLDTPESTAVSGSGSHLSIHAARTVESSKLIRWGVAPYLKEEIPVPPMVAARNKFLMESLGLETTAGRRKTAGGISGPTTPLSPGRKPTPPRDTGGQKAPGGEVRSLLPESRPAMRHGLWKVMWLIMVIGVTGSGLYALWLRAGHFPGTSWKPGWEKIFPAAAPPPALREYVYVPAGRFMMGRNPGRETVAVDGSSSGGKIPEDETPAHMVEVGEFYLARHETTNAEYRKFVVDTGYPPPATWQGNDFPAGQDDFPVTGVSWEDARQYCLWLTKTTGGEVVFRLPTEAEWEYAARGTDGRVFPWGSYWRDGMANTGQAPGRQQTLALPVHVEPNNTRDRSAMGIMGMGGNVCEWTDSTFDTYPGSRYRPGGRDRECKVYRGGHFASPLPEATATSRKWTLPERKSGMVGFRVAADWKGGGRTTGR